MSDDKAPGWISKIVSGKDDRRAKIEAAVAKLFSSPAIIDWKKMYGCGHYGCAYAIKDQPFVVKITRDPTEGPMQAVIGKRQAQGDYGFEGFAIVKSVFRLEPDIMWRGNDWPVYVIVREEILPFNSAWQWGFRPGYGHLRDEFALKAIKLSPYTEPRFIEHALLGLAKYQIASRRFVELKTQYKKDQEEQKMREALNKISVGFPYVGTVMQVLEAEGTPLLDVHSGNIGIRTQRDMTGDGGDDGLGMVVVFDPGHTPSSDEIAAEGDKIVKLNRGRIDDSVILRASEIKSIVAHPNTGLIYVSNSFWNDVTEAVRQHRDTDFILADSSANPMQWKEALKVFPDAGDFRAGENDQVEMKKAIRNPDISSPKKGDRFEYIGQTWEVMRKPTKAGKIDMARPVADRFGKIGYIDFEEMHLRDIAKMTQIENTK